MTDSVISIFKILIKVPIIICISYLILNLFGFAVCYFKIIGASYSLQQIVMENNFLPPKEQKSFCDYISSLESTDTGKDWYDDYRFLRDINVIVQSGDSLPDGFRELDDFSKRAKNVKFLSEHSVISHKNGSGYTSGVISGNNERRQYGNTVTVGIAANFKIMVPLQGVEITGGGVQGMNKDGEYGNNQARQTLETVNSGINRYDGTHATSRYDALTVTVPIKVTHTLIGMQYYSDLAY